jgi:tetratricopeptide (TPR) repeat protein
VVALVALAAREARADEPAPEVKPVAPGAMSDEVRAHYDRGLALYADKDYAGAARELEAGYALDPRREFLFAEAQALRLSGDCKGAVPLYQRFLASDPAEVQVNAAHIALGRCAEQMANATPPATPPPDTTVTRATPPPSATPATPPRIAPAATAPWYTDAAGGVLTGAGVVGLAIGTVFTVAAMTARNDANSSAQSYPDYARFWDSAHRRSQIAVGGFAAGTVLAGAGVVRYLRVRGQRALGPGGGTPTVDAWITPTKGGGGGAIAGVGGRF